MSALAHDIQTDTWTVGAGAEIKAGPGAFQLGGAISYLTSGSQTAALSKSYNATSDGSWAYAVGCKLQDQVLIFRRIWKFYRSFNIPPVIRRDFSFKDCLSFPKLERA